MNVRDNNKPRFVLSVCFYFMIDAMTANICIVYCTDDYTMRYDYIAVKGENRPIYFSPSHGG